jgi:hypothetical protein
MSLLRKIIVHSLFSNALCAPDDQTAMSSPSPRVKCFGRDLSGSPGRSRSQQQKRHVQVNVEREKEEVVQDNDSLMGRGRRVRRPSGRFPSDVWTN